MTFDGYYTPTPAITVLPDVERLAATWLRNVADVRAIVDSRVYTAVPNAPTFPLVRLTRIGGEPVMSRPLHLDEAWVQVDCWGGPKATTRLLAETCRGAFALEAFVGPHDDGVVSGVTFGSFQYLPDDSYEPAKPRYWFTLHIFVHP